MVNVKVLLKEKVNKLGDIGEIVSVKAGYARNYLLPNELAALPSIGEVKRLQKKKELLEKLYQEEKQKAESTAEKLESLREIVIIVKAGEAGKLFGRITAKDIQEKLKTEAGVELQRKQILLRRPISDLGEYEVKFKLHSEVTTQIKVVIKQEEE